MDEMRFTREEVTGVGDPAAAGTDAEGDPAVPPPTGGSQAGGESPAHAARRAAEGDGGRPELAVLGAFAGAFVAAKILGRLTGGRG